MELHHIPFKNEAEWLEERKKGIGGSEIAALVGLDEYITPLDIYLDKTGRSEHNFSDQQLDDMDRGHWLEKPLIDWLSKVTGKPFIHNQDQYLFPANPIIRCTPDGMWSEGKALIQAKSTKLFVTEPLEKWFIQGQWELGVTGYETLYVTWINGHLKRSYAEFARNDKIISWLQEKAIEFWNEHIIPDIPPALSNGSDVLKLYYKHKEGKVYEATVEDYDKYEQLSQIKEQIKALEEQEESLKDELKIKMEDSELMIYSGMPLITWKSCTTSRFDTTAFKKANPELYNQFTKTSEQRRFLVK